MSDTYVAAHMSDEDRLLGYSEWLDSQGLVVGDDGPDKRTHEQLVHAYLHDDE